jgi:Zn-finger nucleic acid-binding protein
MECPRCGTVMREETLDGHHGRQVTVDICLACQSLWFDANESPNLSPGSTLRLFGIIGEQTERPAPARGDLAKCPRCRARLRRTHDRQRQTRFEYLRCPHGHGRLTTWFDFLREKDFIRPLTPQQIAELRQHLRTVGCGNCGAPVDVAAGAACARCGSPLSMLDLPQASRLVEQLRQADVRSQQDADPARSAALPLALARARREAEAAFADLDRDQRWFDDVSSSGLIGASLALVARWLRE